ncbi:hypothetical protein OA92_08500 [Marinomonas sp. SBI22]|uniref:hypothetical protein n=1 Tax=unclassified Marinomonas TaxID=196814 RepID=UPI0007AFDB50|nr:MULTISPECIES: hypothetical protein [unclassified Marinomonas]KZM43712.1 hypothetical protein OA92_08500 [Marinomonas sp. SBI22]KZM47274.1 hypothetical protein OA91_01880 [Marinomonas sp. SBI8L]
MFIFISAFIAGALLPLIISALTWKSEPKLSRNLFILSCFLYLQILGEMLFKVNDLGAYIKYLSAFFVVFRLVHLAYITQLGIRLIKRANPLPKLLPITLILNTLVWPMVLISLVSKF